MNQPLSSSAQPGPPDDELPDAPQDFETALAQLETLVARMEDGDLPLEQSLAAYQRGVALARLCQSLLDKAEAQVKVLQGNLLEPYGTPDAQDEAGERG